MGKNKKIRFYTDLMAFNPEVTGSNILVATKYPDGTETNFIVDIGSFREKAYIGLNEKIFFNPEEIDFALITHNHIDHTGRLPFIVRKGFKNPVYLTKGTSMLIGPALRDTAKIQKEEAKLLKKKPIYDLDDVEESMELLNPVDFNETIQIDEHIRATFFMNGHIPGAAIILTQISYKGEEDTNILFIGDYNNQNILFAVEELPEWVKELPLIVVIESTYGDINTNQIKKNFKENSIQAMNIGKTEIATVCALGRAQEALLETKKWQETGELSKDIGIYLAGRLSKEYTQILLNNPEVFKIREEFRNFLPDNFNYVSGEDLKFLIKDEKQKIIFTTSGMGTDGPATFLLPYYLSNKNALIYFLTYLVEDSTGYKIMNTEYGESVRMRGKLIEKLADAQFTAEYSAHAKGDVLLQLLNSLKNKRFVIVNHGESKTQEIFANRVLKETDAKSVGIFGGVRLFRVNHWGCIKSMPTKFKI